MPCIDDVDYMRPATINIVYLLLWLVGPPCLIFRFSHEQRVKDTNRPWTSTEMDSAGNSRLSTCSSRSQTYLIQTNASIFRLPPSLTRNEPTYLIRIGCVGLLIPALVNSGLSLSDVKQYQRKQALTWYL
ncbi:hypothetical protein F5887DRAFT_569242 [Amanita rubescens]|nr:hypothetical protein F5887DRAFT_569242 [Amanita rubescens]